MIIYMVNNAVNEVFKDVNEMLDWFAYGFYVDFGYRTKHVHLKPMIVDSDNTFRYVNGSIAVNKRYEEMCEYQNLTGNDAKAPSILNILNHEVAFYRDRVLYDTVEKRVLDIRNYTTGIISHIHSAKENTDRYIDAWRKSRLTNNRNRPHVPGYYNHWCDCRRRELIDKSYYIDPDDIPDDVNVKLCRQDNRYQKRSRGHKKPNSWKDKKIRKQWQYHANVTCKSHYSYDESNYCSNDWIEEVE